MSKLTPPERALVLAAAILVFSRVFGLSVTLPNFREHFEVAFGQTGAWIGFAFGAYGLTMAIAQLPYGWLSDRVGRKPMLLLGTAFFVAGSMVSAFAPSLGWLIAGRLLQGFGAISSVATAAVGEFVDPSRRTFAMAMIGILAGTGFLVGVALGPVLYPLISMRGLFLVAGALGLLAGSLALRAPVPDSPGRAPLQAGTLPRIAMLSLSGFTTSALLASVLFFLPRNDAWFLGPMMFVTLVLIGPLAKRIDRTEKRYAPVILGLLLAASAGALFAGTPFLAVGFAAGTLFFVAHSVLASALPSQVSHIAGERGGTAHGVQNLVAYIGTPVGGVLSGAFDDQPFAVFAILGIVAVVASLASARALSD